METRGAGTTPMDGITGAPINTDAAFSTAVTIETWQALFQTQQGKTDFVSHFHITLIENSYTFRAKHSKYMHLSS